MTLPYCFWIFLVLRPLKLFNFCLFVPGGAARATAGHEAPGEVQGQRRDLEQEQQP